MFALRLTAFQSGPPVEERAANDGAYLHAVVLEHTPPAANTPDYDAPSRLLFYEEYHPYGTSSYPPACG